MNQRLLNVFKPNKITYFIFIIGFAIGASIFYVQSSILNVSQKVYMNFVYRPAVCQSSDTEFKPVLSGKLLNQILIDKSNKYDIKYKVFEENNSVDFFLTAKDTEVKEKIAELQKIKTEFMNDEKLFFSETLSNIELSCNNKIYKNQLLKNFSNINSNSPMVSKKFSQGHLIRVLITPFVLLYLIYIIFKLTRLKLNGDI
jgi:hypothetical protein